MNVRAIAFRVHILILAAVVYLLAGCSMPTPPWSHQNSMPAVYHVPLWQWHNNVAAEPERMSIPTTGKNQGPTQLVLVRHDVGLGLSFTDVDVKSKSMALGKQFLTSESIQLTKAGWKALFAPAQGGAYPDFVVYQSFASGSYYCFLEYTATVVNAKHVSQQVDVYYGQ